MAPRAVQRYTEWPAEKALIAWNVIDVKYRAVKVPNMDRKRYNCPSEQIREIWSEWIQVPADIINRNIDWTEVSILLHTAADEGIGFPTQGTATWNCIRNKGIR